jgi:hypothetical protein
MRAIHFQRFDGTIGGAEFVKNMPGSRTAIKVGPTHMQVDNDRIVKKILNACYRCYGLNKVFAPNGKASSYPNTTDYYDCRACCHRRKV